MTTPVLERPTADNAEQLVTGSRLTGNKRATILHLAGTVVGLFRDAVCSGGAGSHLQHPDWMPYHEDLEPSVGGAVVDLVSWRFLTTHDYILLWQVIGYLVAQSTTTARTMMEWRMGETIKKLIRALVVDNAMFPLRKHHAYIAARLWSSLLENVPISKSYLELPAPLAWRKTGPKATPSENKDDDEQDDLEAIGTEAAEAEEKPLFSDEQVAAAISIIDYVKNQIFKGVNVLGLIKTSVPAVCCAFLPFDLC